MSDQPDEEPPKRALTPAAKRALAEADERRRQAEKDAEKEAEINGPKGEEPTRFGDWERKGIAYDF
ncbi:MAG: DUF1674 domain-containing protein [Pseudomonadota bacterium]